MVTFVQVHEWMAQTNLFVLVGVLSALILLSIYLEKKSKFVWHGNAMLVVVMVVFLFTVVHMGPSFIGVTRETVSKFNFVAFLGVVHSAVGIITVSFGAWLVGAWAFSQSSETQFCAPRKKLMWKILVLWILSLGLGLLYYPLHLMLG